MSERVYHTMEKAEWGEGPWIDEPDKIQFKDEVTGYPCLIKRNRFGVLCGYVGVNPGHPFYGLNYNDAEEKANYFDVHGGLTYSNTCREGPESEAICHVPDPGEPDNVWWFGFDCGHGGDLMPGMPKEISKSWQGLGYRSDIYRSVDYVRKECATLAAQLQARSENHESKDQLDSALL